MKIETHLLGRSIRFVDDVTKGPKDYSAFELTRGLQNRYGFLEVPTKLADYNYENGVVFLMGRFNNHKIRRFQIYQLGLVCDAESSTDVSDDFLDDLFSWIEKEFKQRAQEKPNSRLYGSQLELRSEYNLTSSFSHLGNIGRTFQAMLESYGRKVEEVNFHGFKIRVDPMKDAPEFVFERREGKPASEHLYFSSAPLRTSDHQKLLEELEAALTSG